MYELEELPLSPEEPRRLHRREPAPRHPRRVKAPELTQAHRRIVIETLKSRHAEAKKDLGKDGLSAPEQLSLTAILKSAQPPEAAFKQPAIPRAEALEGL